MQCVNTNTCPASWPLGNDTRSYRTDPLDPSVFPPGTYYVQVETTNDDPYPSTRYWEWSNVLPVTVSAPSASIPAPSTGGSCTVNRSTVLAAEAIAPRADTTPFAVPPVSSVAASRCDPSKITVNPGEAAQCHGDTGQVEIFSPKDLHRSSFNEGDCVKVGSGGQGVDIFSPDGQCKWWFAPNTAGEAITKHHVQATGSGGVVFRFGNRCSYILKVGAAEITPKKNSKGAIEHKGKNVRVEDVKGRLQMKGRRGKKTWKKTLKPGQWLDVGPSGAISGVGKLPNCPPTRRGKRIFYCEHLP